MPIPPTLEASFVALATDTASLIAAERAAWKREDEVLGLQMAAMEETIVLLQKEVKVTAAQLEPFTKGGAAPPSAESSREESSPARAAASDLEVKLGQLEDKLLRTEQDLEEARRAHYFPSVDGFTLRFSYQERYYLGFKSFLLERLCGRLRLRVTSGVDADGHRRVPSVHVRFEGGAAGGGAKDDGALLRFLGEGVSLYSRREVLGMSLAPNITLQRMDVSARFVADVPLVYLAKRRAWRLEEGFGIELLHFKQDKAADLGGAGEHMMKMVVQAAVEGLAKKLLLDQLGRNLGQYLVAARHGAELVLDVDVAGIPVATFEAPLGGKGDASRHAARLLELSPSQLARLLAVQAALPDAAAARFRTLAELLRYLEPPGLRALAQRRGRLVELWRRALTPAAVDGAAPADMAALLGRAAALARRPAQVTLRCRALRAGVEPAPALAAACAALKASYAERGAQHASASAAIERFRERASGALATLRRTVRGASTALRGELRGGAAGQLRVAMERFSLCGPLALAAAVTPPVLPDYAVLSHLSADGAMNIELMLRNAAAAAERAPEASTAPLTVRTQPSSEVSRINLSSLGISSPPALEQWSARRSSVRDELREPDAPPLLLSLRVVRPAASLMVADREAARFEVLERQAGGATSAADCLLPPLPFLAALGGAAAASAAGDGDGDGDGGGLAEPSVDLSSSRKESAAPRRLVEVYENQRRLTALRPYSADDMLSWEDRAAWSNETGTQRYSAAEAVALPDGDGWRWVGDWRVDLDSGGRAEDGWQYAIHWNSGWLATSSVLTHVRRRRWVRLAEMNGPAESNEEPMESRRRSEAPVGDAFPFGRGGGATTGAELRVSLADGVSIELSAASVEARGAVVALVDHAADLLGAHLGTGAPGAAPLPPPSPAPTSADREDAEKFALFVARVRHYVCAEQLFAEWAIAISVDADPHGLALNAAALPSEGVSGGGGGGEVCATFTNEINLMDFVRDVHEVYSFLTTDIGFATRAPEVRGSLVG
jgi:hypothetical protein